MKQAIQLMIAVAAVMLTMLPLVTADVPQMINYQGRLTDSAGEPLDTTVSMEFAIYDDSTAGVVKWAEAHPSVTVEGGTFSVILGTMVPIEDSVFNQPDRWLGITVGMDPELMPRTRLVSVGYAQRVSTVDGSTGGMISGDVDIQSDLDVAGTVRVLGFEMSTGAADGYVLTSDGSGVGAWQPTAGTTDNDWTYQVTDTDDTTLMSGGEWGIARAGNVLYGNLDRTHTNFGVLCTTGTSGYNYDYSTAGGGAYNNAGGRVATVSGGLLNRAIGEYATVAGGVNNIASGFRAVVGGGGYNTASHQYATVAGGDANTASQIRTTVSGGYGNSAITYMATVGGGTENRASGYASTICGGYYDTASGENAVVGGGMNNVASGYSATVPGGRGNRAEANGSFACGRDVTITSDASFTFAFGRGFTTSTPNAAIFHDTSVPIKVGIGTTAPEGALDVSSITGALIVPRMTTAQRDALTAVNGMIIYNTTTNQFNFYENSAWVTK